MVYRNVNCRQMTSSCNLLTQIRKRSDVFQCITASRCKVTCNGFQQLFCWAGVYVKFICLYIYVCVSESVKVCAYVACALK